MKVIIATHENIKQTPVASAMLQHILNIFVKMSDDIVVTSRDTEPFYSEFRHAHVSYENFVIGILSYCFVLLKETFELRRGDILYCRSYLSCIIAVFIKLSLFRKYNIIFDTRGLFFDELIDLEVRFSSFLFPFFKVIENILLKNSKLIICVSAAQKSVYINRAPCATERLIVVPNVTTLGNVEDIRDAEVLKIIALGSLSKWHCPQRIAEFGVSLSKVKVNTELHIITRNLKVANSYFFDIPGVKIYAHDFRNRPISFDYGICFIKSSLSKFVCFPVKLAEYLASKTKIIYSNNVDIHNLYLGSPIHIGVDIDNFDSDFLAQNIVQHWFENRSTDSLLPDDFNAALSPALLKLEASLNEI